AAFQEATHHVRAHPAKADHSKLHVLTLTLKTMSDRARSRGAGRWTTVVLVEKIHEFAIAPRDPGDSLFARRRLGAPGNQYIPEDGAADGKADEARHPRGDAEPFPHLLIVLAPAEN